MREEPCDDSVSDRSAVNVAPFQLSEKLRCIHSNHPLFCYHFVVALAKANPSHNPPREDSDHPAPPASVLRERRGFISTRGRLRAQRQRRINKRLAMVSPLAAGVAFQLVLVIAICEDRPPVKPLSRSPHLNTLAGSLSHRSPGPDNCSCYPLPIPCRCS